MAPQMKLLKVKQILRKFKINVKILTWVGRKPNKNIQSISRNARYDLLFSKSRQLGINYILTGHQQGDLIENFFIRMLRGSGLKGLVSLDKKNKINNINLLRTFLDEKREDLNFYPTLYLIFMLKTHQITMKSFKELK